MIYPVHMLFRETLSNLNLVKSGHLLKLLTRQNKLRSSHLSNFMEILLLNQHFVMLKNFMDTLLHIYLL